MSLPQMRKAQKIKQIIPMTNGIFSHMNYEFRAEINKGSMDIMFGTTYGQRNPSPIVEGIQDEYGEQLTDSNLNSLAAIIVQMYKPKWDKLGEIYDIEYDPIHNYLDQWSDTSEGNDAEEISSSGTREDEYGHTISDDNTRTDNLSERELSNRDIDSTRTDNLTELETRNLANSNTRTDNLTEQQTYGKTDTRTDNLASTEDVTTSKTGSGSENNALYGFNSTTAVNSDSTSSSDTSSETVDRDTTNTGTSANVQSGSDSKVNSGTQTNQGTDSGTVTTANTGTERTLTDDDLDRTTTNTGTRSDERDIVHGGTDSRTTSGSQERSLTSQKDRSGRHFGNIGNLTSQKQILEEINLWRWNYMQEILNDVKEFCTLPVYLNASEWSWVDPQ